jgi:tRNA A-37 threonylcarbamoyl transferase component Bud32
MTVSLLSTSADVASDPRGDWLLLRRCRLVFLLGLAASVLLLGVSGVVRSRAGGPVSIAGPTMHAAYVLLFVVGFLSLLRGRPGRLRVESTALAILGAILLTLAVDAASQGTLFPPTLLVTLVLIAASALLPWRVGFQVALVAIALAAYPVSRLVFARDTMAPGVWFWPVDHPDPRASSVLGATAIALIGLVSVIVTWSLYRLRRRALRAEEVGGYRLVDRLGEGGMGTVYRAEHDRMCRSSAVKVVTVGPEMGPLIIERFQREIQLASRLDHPHTIEIRDFGRCDDSTFFYAMEYLVGLDLRQLVRRFGPLPAERTIHVLIQVCDSLSEAHGLGIVHRDLKPANVFLTRRGGISDFVKVLDFGLAGRRPRNTPLHATGGSVRRRQLRTPQRPVQSGVHGLLDACRASALRRRVLSRGDGGARAGTASPGGSALGASRSGGTHRGRVTLPGQTGGGALRDGDPPEGSPGRDRRGASVDRGAGP